MLHSPRLMAAVVCAVSAVLLAAPAHRASAFELAETLADYVVVSWTSRDGLPSGGVRAIVQDREGYLWLGTNAGLFRFDGVRFVEWEALSSTPLPERRILSLLSSTDGSLWVALGGSGGIARIHDGEVARYGEERGLAEDFVRSLMEDRHGTIWAAGRSGLYRFDGEVWHRVGPDEGLPHGPAYDAYEDRRGALWVSARAGLFRRDPGERLFRRIGEGSEFPMGLSEDSSGTLWVTDRTVGFRRLDKPIHASGDFVARSGNGVALLHDRRDNLWLATLGHGLWRVSMSDSHAPQVETISSREGLSNDSVRALLEDREGNIWVGTEGGLHRISLRTVTALLGLGMVRAVEVTGDGTVWVGTAGGLTRIRNGEGERTELPGRVVSALHQDAEGILWVGTNQGLLRLSNGRVVPMAPPPGAQLRTVVAITSDADGSIWLCDREEGLFRWDDGQLKAVDVPAELRRRTPYGAHAGRDGLVWFAFSGGMLSAVDAGARFSLYELPSGLSGSLRFIYEDGSALWVAGDDGLTRVVDGRFVTAGQRNGLPGNAVSAVIKDSEGYMWAGVGVGIIRFHPDEFDALAEDPGYQIRYAIYDASDGVAGEPSWRGNPSAVRGPDGRLWFVTAGGLTVVDPRVPRENASAPRVRIEDVVLDEQRREALPDAALPPRPPKLQIEYTTLGLASPTKVRFRYRLDGFDPTWIDAGASRQAVYRNLPPGKYRFQVVATTSEGVWSQSGDTWEFSIRPAFYETTWFYGACATAAVLLVWGAWQLRLRQVRHEFTVVLAERARLSREIHDTLLQNLAAVALHFESLARKLAVSSPALKEDAIRIRREIEEYLRETREAVWALRSSASVQRDLPAMIKEAGERCTAGSGTRFSFTMSGTPRRWPVRTEQQLLRIAQEAIQNAVRHASATHIRVSLEYAHKAQELRLRVSDDGCGFDPAQSSGHDGCHYGLTGMRERAGQIGGRFTIVTAPGKGTEVEVVVPLDGNDRRA